MKQYKTTIISLIIIVVIITVFAVFSFVMNKSGEDVSPTPTPEEITSEKVFNIADIADIASYECNIVDEIKVEQNTSGEWSSSSYNDMTLDTSLIKMYVNSARQCLGVLVYDGEINSEIIKNYGISSTEYIKITLKDGTVYTMRLGMKKPGTSSYFAVVEETGKVYLINSTQRDNVILTKENILHTRVFNFDDTGKIRYIETFKKNKRFFYLESKFEEEDVSWNMLYPLERPGADSYIKDVISALTTLSTAKYIEGDCEDLAKYGLENPAYHVKMADYKSTQTLSLGNRTPAGDAYYCIFGGDRNVFTVKIEAITFIDDSVLKYMDVLIFNEMYTNLESIKVDINCADVKESFFIGFDIWEDGEQLYYNGEALPDDNKIVRSLRRVHTALYSIDLVGLEDEPKEKGELLISVVYKKSNGETVTVEGFRRDETTMSLYRDGVYCGGYDHIRQITGNNDSYGIKGTLDNFRTLSGMK